MTIFLQLALVLLIRHIDCGNVQYSKIQNTSLTILNKNSITIDGTCAQCLCQMHNNPNFSSFNCYSSSRTCQMHFISDQYQLFRVFSSSSSTFFYRSLPQCHPSANCNSLSVTTCNFMLKSYSASELGTYTWNFDSSLVDQTSTLNFTWVSSGSPTWFSSKIITGSGQSLLLNSSLNYYISIPHSFPNLANRSWTFELWIYLLSVPNVDNVGIISQCESPTHGYFLHIVIRYQKLYFGFYFDDVAGFQTILPNQWYHLAFVFDHSSRNQSIFINGFLDSTRQSSQYYLGQLGELIIGLGNFSNPPGSDLSLKGYIDQLQFSNRSKSSDEILNDATLTCYFSFDNQSLEDRGPLGLRGVLNGSTASFTTGRVGDALQISPNHTYFFQIQNLIHLGMNGRSYSMSIWIFPSSQQPSSIIHVSSDPHGVAGWRVSMLTIQNGGHLAIASYNGTICVPTSGPIVSPQQWTHVAFTYSLVNGLRLYVNGTFASSTAPFSYSGGYHTMYLTFGTNLFNHSISCGTPFPFSQYFGLLDEFRLYSRELSSDEVLCLAHPS